MSKGVLKFGYIEIEKRKFYHLLDKYNTIWIKASADIKDNLIKSHGDEGTDFHNKEIPKVDSNHTCLAIINLGFVLKRR